MARYVRAEVIAWLKSEGCRLGEPVIYGLAFHARDWTPFVIPDPDDDGWLDADMVLDVLTNRWTGVGPCPLVQHD